MDECSNFELMCCNEHFLHWNGAPGSAFDVHNHEVINGSARNRSDEQRKNQNRCKPVVHISLVGRESAGKIEPRGIPLGSRFLFPVRDNGVGGIALGLTAGPERIDGGLHVEEHHDRA